MSDRMKCHIMCIYTSRMGVFTSRDTPFHGGADLSLLSLHEIQKKEKENYFNFHNFSRLT